MAKVKRKTPVAAKRQSSAKASASQTVIRFRAKTGNEIVPCALRHGRVPPILFKELQALVKPTLVSWSGPKAVANNDFGSADVYNTNGAVNRDNGGDLCWLGNDCVPKTKVSAGPYRKLGPEGVRCWVRRILEKNRPLLKGIERFADATYDSSQGPKPAFAAKVANSIFSYICMQRRWPMEGVDGSRLPWHVDGGPSICFMAVSLEGERILEYETWEEDRKNRGRPVVKRIKLRPGDWYWTSPTSFWHRVVSEKGRKGKGVSTVLLLRSAIMLRRISGGRVNAQGKKTAGMKYASRECFCKLAEKFANIIGRTELKW